MERTKKQNSKTIKVTICDTTTIQEKLEIDVFSKVEFLRINCSKEHLRGIFKKSPLHFQFLRGDFGMDGQTQ